MPSRKKINSIVLILNPCVLVLILLNSSDGYVNFTFSSEAFADSPKLSTSAHLEKNYFQRPPRWAKHHVAHASIELSLMAGAFKTSARPIEVHRTSGVRTSPAVRHEFAVGRA
jgi:hypothetical protein